MTDALPLEDVARRARHVLRDVLRRHRAFPALSLLLVTAQGTRFVSAARGSAPPPTAAQQYAIASCLKPMTALVCIATIQRSLGVAVAEALRAPLSNWVGPAAHQAASQAASQAAPQAAPPAAPIAPLGDLLRHQLAPNGLFGNTYVGAAPPATLDGLGSIATSEELLGLRFRTENRYSNAAYGVAGYLVAHAGSGGGRATPRTWRDYADRMRACLWAPLGMTSTDVVPDPTRLAQPHSWMVLHPGSRRGEDVLTMRRFAAVSAAEGYSTPEDMAKLLRLLAGIAPPANPAEGDLAAVLDVMRTPLAGPHLGGPGGAVVPGLGLMHIPALPGWLWHRGDRPGFQTAIAVLPGEHPAAVAVFTNVGGEDEASQQDLNELGQVVNSLAQHSLIALTRGTPLRVDDVAGPPTTYTPPLAARYDSARDEVDLAFAAAGADSGSDLLVLQRGRRRLQRVAPSPGPWTPDKAVGALNGLGPDGLAWVPSTAAAVPGFLPSDDQDDLRPFAGLWRGSFSRPGWWSNFTLSIAEDGQGWVRLKNTGPRLPLAPAARAGSGVWDLGPPPSPDAPFVHAGVVLPASGAYGFLVAGLTSSGTLLGTWSFPGQRYHVSLWPAAGEGPQRWRPMPLGRWSGHVRLGPAEALPLWLLVEAGATARSRRGRLGLGAGVGAGTPLPTFHGLHGAMHWEARETRYVSGWGSFSETLCVGSVLLDGKRRRFLLQR